MLNLTVQELKARLDAGLKMIIVDGRESWEYDICHLPDSRLIPLAALPLALTALHPDAEIVLVRHHGIRSLQAARFLEQAGYARVYNLEGGMATWAHKVDQNMPRY